MTSRTITLSFFAPSLVVMTTIVFLLPHAVQPRVHFISASAKRSISDSSIKMAPYIAQNQNGDLMEFRRSHLTKRSADLETTGTDDVKRAFKLGKKFDSVMDATNLGDEFPNSIENKRAFKFGKKSADDTNMAGDDKRAFKFGKKSVDSMKSSDSSEQEVEKRPVVKFGKKSVNAEDEEELLKYLSEDDRSRRAFKFGKKAADLGDERHDDLEYDEKRAFKFGKRTYPSDNDPSFKRAFKFGKKSTDFYEHDSYDSAKRAFKFGKKSDDFYAGDDSESSNEALDKRAFKFGKKKSSGRDHHQLGGTADDEGGKRMFKFGRKRSVDHVAAA